MDKNSSKLTKREFLKFLKRQRQKNVIEGILPPFEDEPIPDAHEKQHNNANANHSNVPQAELNNLENKFPTTKEECTEDLGYRWNNENMICEDLKVTFYSGEGENGSSFELTKGNYDKSQISLFDFEPSFMAVPMGLRVKIWEKPGYVGNNLGFLGNNLVNGKKNLYPVKNLGSLQICNMKSCVKPSEFGEMTLISMIDGDNIDFVENNVKNLGEYKEKLREKIHKKLLEVRFTHKDCLELVSKYLKNKDINLDEDLSDIENSFTLQKINYELSEIPSCEELIRNKSKIVLTPSESIDEELTFSPIETMIEKLTPSESIINNFRNEESSETETENLSFIIFIFVFLLITLLIAALIYFYINPKK